MVRQVLANRQGERQRAKDVLALGKRQDACQKRHRLDGRLGKLQLGPWRP